jgi:hypothetical protein
VIVADVALATTAFVMVGALGGVEGVIAFDGADAGEVPLAFVAVTVKVYVVPMVSPVMPQVKAPVVVQV